MELDPDILNINQYTKLEFRTCILCEKNERKLLVDQQTIRQTDRQHQNNIPCFLRKGEELLTWKLYKRQY